ncbi:hypothetical protein AAFF_G00437900 [Aldrovandia affinis]|uniref:Reverse transcriptase n=1 Tax=Aldrovandia affinis TaxID=143900 RepID=A0AAD7WIQ5_9TELE|nr:hypothetical protein AAFF_G00437900 [Aldrovandia affinis]
MRTIGKEVLQVATRISAYLTDISDCMAAHHLRLNLKKTELLFLPGKACPLLDLSITIDNSVVSPTLTAKNLGVTLDGQLWCRFMAFNIRRVRLFLTRKVAQVLVQALISWLDYGNSLLAGAHACAIKPLQLIQDVFPHHPTLPHPSSAPRSCSHQI